MSLKEKSFLFFEMLTLSLGFQKVDKQIENSDWDFSTQLDEFAIIRKAIDKIKSLAGSAKKWISDFFKKIMVRVKKTLQAIKKLGAKMFDALLKFLGLELKSVKETIPTDIHGFVYGMVD